MYDGVPILIICIHLHGVSMSFGLCQQMEGKSSPLATTNKWKEKRKNKNRLGGGEEVRKLQVTEKKTRVGMGILSVAFVDSG